MASAKSSQEYFVSVEEPVEIRKNLLESSRSIIHLLQAHEKIRELRKEKNEQVQKIDALMRDINSLSNRLRNQLPRVPSKKKQPAKAQKKPTIVKKEPEKKPIHHRKHEAHKPMPVQPAPKPVVVRKEKSSLELLEEELMKIENQLNGMK